MSQEKQTKLSVSRKEVKYLLSLQDRLFLLDALDHILTPDAWQMKRLAIRIQEKLL